MYSLAGIAAVPLMRDILKGSEFKLKKAIFSGVFITALVYLVFTLVTVGVSGSMVSKDALSGLAEVMGHGVVLLGAVFGLFAIATSYIAYAFYAKNTFIYDFKIKENIAFAIIVLVPILLLFLISADFVGLVIFLGAIFGGIESIFLIALYKKAKKEGNRKPEYSLNIPYYIFWFMTVVFLIGIFYEIFYAF